MAKLKDLIKSDPRVQRALKRLKHSELDVEALKKEMMSMHATRDIRMLSTKKVLQSSVTNLIDAKLTDSSGRSRATEIKVKALIEILDRDKILNSLRKYILAAYGPKMKNSFKTITAQKAYIDVLLERQLEVSTGLNNLIKIIDLVVEDIDQGGWTLKMIQETLASLSKEKYD